jgi:hypothetical protein
VGYKVSMYALAPFLYRPNSGDANDDEARRLPRLVEGPEEGAPMLPWKNLTCTKRCSRIISVTLHLWPWTVIVVPPLSAPVPRQDDVQCAGHGCGNNTG